MSKKVALITFFIEDVGMSKENEMINYFKRKKSLFPESKWKEASAK